MPAPKKSGSALETLAVSVLPVLERHAEPLVVKMTVEAVFVKPDHGAQLFAAGTLKLGPTKVVPPEGPKPPAVAMQKGPPPGKVWPEAKWMVPLVLIKRPVSTGALAVADASTLSVPFGDAVLLPVGSTCSWKRGATTDIEDELKAELLSLMNCELKPLEAVAVPSAGMRTCPFSIRVAGDGHRAIHGQGSRWGPWCRCRPKYNRCRRR